MRYIIRHIFLIFWLFVFHGANGQDAILKQVNKYTINNGLSSYNIHKIKEDKNGYIWVGTQYGLSRFDGKQFIDYSRNARPNHQFAGVDIRDLLEDTARSLFWVLPGDELEVNAIDITTYNVVRKIALPNPNLEEFNMAFALQGNYLWLGSSTGLRLLDLLSGKFENVLGNPVYKNVKDNHDLEVNTLHTDFRGNVWCFHSGFGLVIYDGANRSMIKYYPLNFFNDHMNSGKIIFNGCISLNTSSMLVATSQGLRIISFDSLYNVSVNASPCQCKPGLNIDEVDAICKTQRGDILLASHNELLQLNSTLDSSSTLRDAETSMEGDWLAAVQSIYCDDEDNVWLGCQQGMALIRSGVSPFLPYYYDKPTNSKLEHVRTIYVTKEGDMLIGLRNGMAKICAATNNISITDKGHLYHHIFEDKSGNIQVSRQDGLYLYVSGQLTSIDKCYPEFKPFSKNPVNSHLFLGDSVIVFGTENDKGILIWNYKKHLAYQLDNASDIKLASSVVNNIYKDEKGRIWVLSDHVVSLLSTDLNRSTSFTIYDSATRSSINLLFDVCELKNSFWIAAYGSGLVELDATLKVKHVYNTQHGLSDNGVYQLFHWNNILAITTDKGLSVFDIDKRTFKNYYQSDGLHSNSFEEVAGVSSNNLFYAGGVKGFTIIDPSKFISNTTPPKVYVNRIFVDRSDGARDIDTTNLELTTLNVPNDVLQVTLYFSGINYRNPERTDFEYRIKDKQADWVSIGPQNYINLIGLQPGKYELEVRAANEDGVWSRPQMLTLVYLPKWYQTLWFKGLLLFTGIGIGYVIYRVRLNQILRQQEIRKEVASDLHDDIGSSLNSVKVFAHLIRTNPLKNEYIQNVEDNLEHATIGVRDMIWVLDDNRDTIADMCDRLRQLAAKPAEAVGIDVTFSIENNLASTKLSKSVKRNLFLIVKEAINNCVKYAGCTEISVILKLQNKKLQLQIKDNGKGFDITDTSKGYGLTNMRTRAGQIQFNFTIASGQGGTDITLTKL